MSINKTDKAEKYEKISKIGEGTFGIVYKAIDKKSNSYVALKKVRLMQEEEGIPSTAIREIALLKELIHVNIVKLIDVMHSTKKLTLVFEFIDTDLKKIIDKSEGKGLDKSTCKSFLYQILKGMSLIHKLKILHRDMKPQNLLVTNDGIIKIADFGLSRGFGIPVKNYTHEVVTLWYRPPDVLIGNKNYYTSIDIWSIGCIFAEMLLGRVAFQGQNEDDQLDRILSMFGCEKKIEKDVFEWKYPLQKDIKDVFPSIIDEDCLDLLGNMLNINPELRISIDDALKHRYFNNLPDEVERIYKN